MPEPDPPVGTRFGLLTYLGLGRLPRKGRVDSAWLVRCDCGRIKLVLPTEVRRGKVRGCGCQRGHPTHRMSGSKASPRGPEYTAWRVLHVDAGLVESFPEFYAALGPRPSPAHVCTRRDPRLPYTVANMFWTLEPSWGNPRVARVRLDGLVLPLPVAALRLGVTRQTMYHRIRRGMYELA